MAMYHQIATLTTGNLHVRTCLVETEAMADDSVVEADGAESASHSECDGGRPRYAYPSYGASGESHGGQEVVST